MSGPYAEGVDAAAIVLKGSPSPVARVEQKEATNRGRVVARYLVVHYDKGRVVIDGQRVVALEDSFVSGDAREPHVFRLGRIATAAFKAVRRSWHNPFHYESVRRIG